jgi:hypothetical protein
MVPRRAMTGIGHPLRVNRMGGITMSDQNGSVPLCGMWGVPAKQGRSWSPRMTHSRPRRDRTTCSGIRLQAGGRRCRKTTLHPSGYCHVHCDPERHHRECEGHAACSLGSISIPPWSENKSATGRAASLGRGTAGTEHQRSPEERVRHIDRSSPAVVAAMRYTVFGCMIDASGPGVHAGKHGE